MQWICFYFCKAENVTALRHFKWLHSTDTTTTTVDRYSWADDIMGCDCCFWLTTKRGSWAVVSCLVWTQRSKTWMTYPASQVFTGYKILLVCNTGLTWMGRDKMRPQSRLNPFAGHVAKLPGRLQVLFSSTNKNDYYDFSQLSLSLTLSFWYLKHENNGILHCNRTCIRHSWAISLGASHLSCM